MDINSIHVAGFLSPILVYSNIFIDACLFVRSFSSLSFAFARRDTFVR